MLSKRYESTEVDSRTWLHVPSETRWSTSIDTHQEVAIKKKRLLLRCIHHFKSDLINEMDHMRILGTDIISEVFCLNISKLLLNSASRTTYIPLDT